MGGDPPRRDPGRLPNLEDMIGDAMRAEHAAKKSRTPTAAPPASPPPARPSRRPTAEILATYQVAKDTMVRFEPPFLAGLFSDPIKVTKTEAAMLDEMSSFSLYDMQKIKEASFSEAEERYPGKSSAARNDGHQDAFRHAYWNARMALQFGGDFAEKFATAHEGAPGNPADREAMDLYNNEVGRRIAADLVAKYGEFGARMRGPLVLGDLVHKAVERGEMVVIDKKGELVYSDQIKYGEHGKADDKPAEGGKPGEKADYDVSRNRASG